MEEVHEETGITISARTPVYTFDFIERDKKGNIQFHYVIVDLMADYISGQPLAGDDASEARWITSKDLDALPVSENTRKAMKKLDLIVTMEFTMTPSAVMGDYVLPMSDWFERPEIGPSTPCDIFNLLLSLFYYFIVWVLIPLRRDCPMQHPRLRDKGSPLK